jgi:hypothetical protein
MSEPSIAQGMRPNHHSLDEDTASRLLQGVVHPDDAPPGYAAVAGLLHSAAQLPLGPVDEDAAATTVSAMVEVIRDATPAPEISRRKSMLGKLLAGKALAAVAVVGLTATGAAAATGSLPDQAQAVVSDAAGHVGVNIPHPNHGKSKHHRQDGEHKPSGDDEAPSGDDSGEPNKGMSGTVEELKNARATATDPGPLGQDVCVVASKGNCVHPDPENAGKGGGDDEAPETEGPKENQGRSDEHGKPEVTPPTTPATGSIATGEDHSGQDDLPVSDKGKAGSEH